MGSQFSQMQNKAIAPFAFHAPEQATYTKKNDILYLHTIQNHRIATYFVNYQGESKTYWGSDQPYNDHRTFVILSHGNADDIGSCKAYCKWLAETFDINVMTYDYVNYGLSEKIPTTEKNMHEAITAVYEFVTRNLAVPQQKIVLMGKSLGTAPTVFLAAKDFMDDIFGVILVSPLASGIRAIMPQKLVTNSAVEGIVKHLDSVFCPSVNLINFIRVPVFVVHGKQDDVIPIQNAELLVAKLHRKAYYPPLYVHAKHNDVESGNSILFRDQMIAFFKSCAARKSAEGDEEHLVQY